MGKTALRGNPVQVAGELPSVGSTAPAFTLTNAGLQDVGLDAWAGKKKVLNIFPSVDTPVCATSIRTFNEKASSKDGVVVLNISADLPFAMKRFCGAEGLENVESLSTFRDGSFQEAYGVRMVDGPLAGLCARSVVVLDADNAVVHTEMVSDIVEEPDYEAALAAL